MTTVPLTAVLLFYLPPIPSKKENVINLQLRIIILHYILIIWLI